MQLMTRKGMYFLFGAAFLALVETSSGQKASNWRAFKMADGLPESTCVSVTIAPNGKVLVRHLNQPVISELDGYKIRILPAPETGKGRVYESPGGQLWTVVRDGLEEFKDGEWVLHPLAEIANEFRNGIPRAIDPVPLCPIRQGVVVLLFSDRLLEFDAGTLERTVTRVLADSAEPQIGRFTGLTQAQDGGLWVAGERGLAKLVKPLRPKAEGNWQVYIPPKSLHVGNLQELRDAADNGVTALAENESNHEKLLVCFDGRRWTTEPAGTEKVKLGWQGPDGAWWAATSDALFDSGNEASKMTENEDIAARRYNDVAVEADGAFWLATSDGLFRYSQLAWRAPAAAKSMTSPVSCLTSDAQGQLWFVAGGRLHTLREDGTGAFPFPTNEDHVPPLARAVFSLKDGALVVDTGAQLIRFHPVDGLYSMIPSDGRRGSQFKILGIMNNGSLCFQSSTPDTSERLYRLETYDGAGFKDFENPPPDPFMHSELSALFTAQDGSLYLGGDCGIAWFHDKKWQNLGVVDKSAQNSVVGFAELPNGRIWCATQDRIMEFDGHSWLVVRSGFDNINGMLRTHDGSIWVASNSGLHRYFQGAWVENSLDEGLPSSRIRDICEDDHGRLWVATTHGLSMYHPDADLDVPAVWIQRLPGNDYTFPEGRGVLLEFDGQDKWKFTPRDRLLYSYRLDGRDWSAFSEMTRIPFSELPAGRHYFQVRAMDRNCNITGQGSHDPKPAELEFIVAAPWYKETRLVLISLAALTVALFFGGVAYNRHRRLFRSHAEVEQKVAQRTHELEVANRELLQSQKMIALGTLAAGIAHDFNNILSIIKGSAQIIEDNLDSPEKVRVRLSRIKTVVEQGAGVVKAMLGFSRESDPQASPCDINAVVDDTVKLLGDQFLREVRVRFEPAPNLSAIPVSRDFIQQILLNFFFNAAESMTGRKEIDLTIRQIDRPPEALALTPAQTASYVGISVRDCGCGIAPENMSRIFEPFFTTKALSARRGTGLGLSMVYELARKMKAGLAVESVPGRGSTFTLILPVHTVLAPADRLEEADFKSAP